MLFDWNVVEDGIVEAYLGVVMLAPFAVDKHWAIA
jgi:hypothetical protein